MIIKFRDLLSKFLSTNVYDLFSLGTLIINVCTSDNEVSSLR